MIKHALIEEILKRNKITDYLESKGIYPATKENSNKIKYCCPLHDETLPSFVVYSDSEYENFFCYGCKAGGSFISLYASLEGLSFVESIKKLGYGIEITDEAELDIIIRKMKNVVEERVKKDENFMAMILVKLGIISYEFIESFGFEKETTDFIEKFYKKIDNIISSENNINSLEEIYNMIMKDRLFTKKSKEFKVIFSEKEKKKLIDKTKELEGVYYG